MDDSYTKAWLNAAESTRKLHKALETPLRLPGEGRLAGIDLLERVTEDLQKGPNSLYSLRRLVEPAAFRAMFKQSKADGLADGRKYQALLATTWPSVAQRQQLWAEYRARSRHRHDTTLADFDAPRPKLPDLTEWGEAEQTRGRDRLLQGDLTRAKRSLSRLRMVTDKDTTAITELLARAEANRKDQARWAALAEGLRQAWAKARTEEAP